MNAIFVDTRQLSNSLVAKPDRFGAEEYRLRQHGRPLSSRESICNNADRNKRDGRASTDLYQILTAPVYDKTAAGSSSGWSRHMVARRSKSEMRDEVHYEHQRWLLDVLAQTGKRPSQLAIEAGLSDTAVTRILNQPSYRGTLSPTTIRSICELTGLAGPGGFPPARKVNHGPSEDAIEYLVPAPSQSDPVRSAIATRPNATAWTMASELLMLQGVRPGDLLIMDADVMPRDGDVVLAEFWGGQKPTMLVRLYQQPNLVAASYDASAAKPLLIDGVTVRVAGVMTDLIRRRR